MNNLGKEDEELWNDLLGTQISGRGKNPWRSYRARKSSDAGHLHEKLIEGACRWYRAMGVARITKTPEPFRVRKKNPDGTALVSFTAHAEPDFKGSLRGGKLICFEAKFTSTDRMKQDVVTRDQAAALTEYAALGAVTGVCVGIGDQAFFVPWEVFSHMKEIFGRKYATAEDLKPWRVESRGMIKFLDRVKEDGK